MGKLLRFYTHFGAGFVVGSIYVSLVMTSAKLAFAIFATLIARFHG